MPKRISRAQVGKLIDRSATALSDDLLLDEAAAQEAMEAVFVEPIPVVREWLNRWERDGWQTVMSRGNDQKIVGVVQEVVADCYPIVAAMMVVSGDKAAKAIRVELGAIERNLGRKYDGLANAAVDATLPLVAGRRTELLDVWVADMAEGLVSFEAVLRDDLRAAALGEETVADVDRRVFHDKQVNRPGHSGRGCWWQPFSRCVAAMRSQEFNLVNSVRQHSIFEFNKRGVELRDG